MRFVEKPLLSDISQDFSVPVANAVVYVLNREVLDRIPSHGVAGFVEDMLPSFSGGNGLCFGFDVGDGYRLDIGTLEFYFSMQMAALQGRFEVDVDWPALGDRLWVGAKPKIAPGVLSPPALMGEDVEIGESATVQCSVIGSRARIGCGACVTNSILFDGVRVGREASISNSILAQGCVIGDGCEVPGNSVLAGGEVEVTSGLWIGNEVLEGLLHG